MAKGCLELDRQRTLAHRTGYSVAAGRANPLARASGRRSEAAGPPKNLAQSLPSRAFNAIRRSTNRKGPRGEEVCRAVSSLRVTGAVALLPIR
jgi:hypothetical protein